MTIRDDEAEAEALLRDGFAQLAAAFNLTQRRRWRFDPEVREAAAELLHALVRLFHESANQAKRRAAARHVAAAGDLAFQQFMGKVLAPRRPRRGRKRQGSR